MPHARYGEALSCPVGASLVFPHFELRHLRREDEFWEACGRTVRVEVFEARVGGEVTSLSWSPGLGEIGPTHFTIAGLEFSLEMAISDRLGMLPEDALVVWPQFAAPASDLAGGAEYGAPAELGPGASLSFPDFTATRARDGRALKVRSADGERRFTCAEGHVHRVIIRGRHFALAWADGAARAWPLPTRSLEAIDYGEPAEYGLAYAGPILGNEHGVPPGFFFDLPYPGFTLRFCGGPFGASETSPKGAGEPALQGAAPADAIYAFVLAPGRIDRTSAPLLGLTGPSPEYLAFYPPAAALERGEPQRFQILERPHLLQLIRRDDAGPLPTGALAVWPDD